MNGPHLRCGSFVSYLLLCRMLAEMVLLDACCPTESQYNCSFVAGQGLHDVSFAALPIKGAFTPLSSVSTRCSSSSSLSLSDGWALFNFLTRGCGTASPQCHCPNSVRNPNKAICTIEASTTKVGVSQFQYYKCMWKFFRPVFPLPHDRIRNSASAD